MRTTVLLTLAAIAGAPLTGQSRVRSDDAPRPTIVRQYQAQTDRDAGSHDRLLRDLRRIIREEVREVVREEVRDALREMGMGRRSAQGRAMSPWVRMRGNRGGMGRGMGRGVRSFTFQGAPDAIELDVEVEEGEGEGSIFRALRLSDDEDTEGSRRALIRTLLRAHEEAHHDDDDDHDGDGHHEEESEEREIRIRLEHDGNESQPRVIRWLQSAPKDGKALVLDVPGEGEVFAEILESEEEIEEPKADAADPHQLFLRMRRNQNAPAPEAREARDALIEVRRAHGEAQGTGDAVDQLRELETRKKLDQIRGELQEIEFDRAGGKASVESKARQLEELRRSLESMRKSLEAMRERVEQQRKSKGDESH